MLKATLLTGRSLRQGIGKELGKFSDKYQGSISICEMCSKDMEEAGFGQGEHVSVRTDHGSVVLKCISSNAILRRGVIFIPYGPYASRLIGSDTSSTGMPTFKGIPAEVAKANQEEVQDIRDLLLEYLKR